MKNNIQTVLKFIAVISAITGLLCSLSLPVFANTPTDPVEVPYTTTPVTDGLRVYDENTSGGGVVIFSKSSDSGTVYAFAVYNGTSADLYVGTDDNTIEVSFGFKYGYQAFIANGYSSSQWSIDATTDLYYMKYNRGPYSTDYINVPIYNSISEGLSAISGTINGSVPHQLSLSIPAGNALVVDINNLSTVEIHFSISTEVAHPSSWYTNQYYSFMSGYPSSIGNRPSNANTINWTGYGQTTLFNRYKSFYWNNTVGSSSGFICITNPYASLDEYDQSFNPTIYVTFSEARGYKYYQLTGGISSDGNIGQHSDGTTASGYYDDNTGQWNTTDDETGLPWTPQEGGGNLITTNSINDWLKTIATQISNFFQGAIGAVTTLVNAGSAFINTLINLYSWLPAPVYAVLSSALILVITIGVIKVFI